MGSIRALTVALVAFVLILMMTTEAVEATYRKPPFNGSIFGKRAGSNNNGIGIEFTKFKIMKTLYAHFIDVYLFFNHRI